MEILIKVKESQRQSSDCYYIMHRYFSTIVGESTKYLRIKAAYTLFEQFDLTLVRYPVLFKDLVVSCRNIKTIKTMKKWLNFLCMRWSVTLPLCLRTYHPVQGNSTTVPVIRSGIHTQRISWKNLT